jgi:hypothetical protein
MFAFLKHLLPSGRTAADPAARRAERARLAAAQAEAAAALDEYDRVNYCWVVNRDRANAAIAAGAIAGSPESHATAYPPPTPEQWAKLTPVQKANVADPVLPENLP